MDRQRREFPVCRLSGLICLAMAFLAGCGSYGTSPRRACDAPALERDALAHLHPDEELWIVAVPHETDRPAPEPTMRLGAGTAQLRVQPNTYARLHLEHVHVQVSLEPDAAFVDVHQRFVNQWNVPGEVLYEFALPTDARVRQFVMVIDGRRIRGVIRPQAEAQALYDLARSEGLRAWLLTMPKPGLFTHRLSHVEPQQSLTVELQYRQPAVRKGDHRQLALPAALVQATQNCPDPDHPPLIIRMARRTADLELIASPHQLLPPPLQEDEAIRPYHVAFAEQTDENDLVLAYRVVGARTAIAPSHPSHGLGDDSELHEREGFLIIDARRPVDRDASHEHGRDAIRPASPLPPDTP